jgi:hypothetical protein
MSLVFSRVIAPEPIIRPRGRAAEALVLHNRCVCKQLFFSSVLLQAFISAQPDALSKAFNLAASLARTAAWAVSLILGTLGFGTEKRHIGQRAIAAVFASVQKRLAHLFNNA